MLYQARKQLSEFADKLRQDIKHQVEEKVMDLEEAIKTDDLTKIKASMDLMQQELMKMGTAMYDQQGTTQDVKGETKDTQTSEQNQDDDVIDADFTHKK